MKFWISINMRNYLLLTIAALTVVLSAEAQTTNISPYSRFGLGDVHDQTQAEQFSMGGLSVPVIDPFALNIANPASYTSLARPLFSVGMRLHMLNIRTATQTQSNQNHTINNLAVAFPLARQKWGLTVGVVPFSTIGYNIVQEAVSPEFEEAARFEYIGEGGITRAFIGNAFQLYNRKDSIGNRTSLSAGANVSYLFGNVNRLRKSIFPDGSDAFNVRVTDAVRVDDFDVTLGVNYTTYLKKMTENDKSYTRLILGATFRVPHQLGITGSVTAETYTQSSANSIEVAKDTVSYTQFERGGVQMPMALGIGASLDMVTRGFKKIMVGAEYRYEQWTQFDTGQEGTRIFDEMGDSHKYIVGADFMPTSKVSRNVVLKTRYRMGVRYEQTRLILNNEQLDAYGISFGLGIPISLKRPQSPSTFNIGVELGQRGATDNNLIREDYLMISFGLTLMPHFRNAWFVQRKYD